MADPNDALTEPLLTKLDSARGPLSVIAAARALAVLRGRNHVLTRDIDAVVRDPLRHRLVLSYQALAEEVTADTVLDQVPGAVAAPHTGVSRASAAA